MGRTGYTVDRVVIDILSELTEVTIYGHQDGDIMFGVPNVYNKTFAPSAGPIFDVLKEEMAGLAFMVNWSGGEAPNEKARNSRG